VPSSREKVAAPSARPAPLTSLEPPIQKVSTPRLSDLLSGNSNALSIRVSRHLKVYRKPLLIRAHDLRTCPNLEFGSTADHPGGWRAHLQKTQQIKTFEFALASRSTVAPLVIRASICALTPNLKLGGSPHLIPPVARSHLQGTRMLKAFECFPGRKVVGSLLIAGTLDSVIGNARWPSHHHPENSTA
jgi:hypothetical protein